MPYMKILLAGLLVLSPMVADADLIDQGDRTLDTETGLEWLDVTLTQGVSYNDIIGGFGGYVADGYRYATESELCELFRAFGDEFPCAVYTTFTEIPLATGNSLIALLGDTGFPGTSGFFDNGRIEDFFQVGGALISCTDSGCKLNWSAERGSLSTSFGTTGSYLVRSQPASVSEPGTLALLGLGLAGIGMARRRKVA